jgi:hypothetical protein
MTRVIFGLAGAAVLILILVLALATRHAPAFNPGQKAVLNRAVTCHATTTVGAGTPVVVIGTSIDHLYVGVQILSKQPIYDGKKFWHDCLVPNAALTRLGAR